MKLEDELHQAKILLKMVLSEGKHIDVSTLKAIDTFIYPPIKPFLVQLREQRKQGLL